MLIISSLSILQYFVLSAYHETVQRVLRKDARQTTGKVTYSAKLLSVEEIANADGVCFRDVLYTDKDEPLDASHGAEIMAREVDVSIYCFIFYFIICYIQLRFAKESNCPQYTSAKCCNKFVKGAR